MAHVYSCTFHTLSFCVGHSPLGTLWPLPVRQLSLPSPWFLGMHHAPSPMELIYKLQMNICIMSYSLQSTLHTHYSCKSHSSPAQLL